MFNRVVGPYVAAMLATSSMGVQAADLTIQLTGIEVARGGAVQVAIYRDAAAFEAYETGAIFLTLSRQLIGLDTGERNQQSMLSFTMTDMPPGQYAVHYYHDANNNQQFDSEGSEPFEGWGMSKARHMWQTPTFKKAAFTLGDESVVMPLKTFYVE